MPKEIKYKGRVFHLTTDRDGKFINYYDESDGYSLSYSYSIIQSLNDEIGGLEEESEIDIQSIEEMTIRPYGAVGLNYIYIEEKYNELLQAIKQLDKK